MCVKASGIPEPCLLEGEGFVKFSGAKGVEPCGLAVQKCGLKGLCDVLREMRGHDELLIGMHVGWVRILCPYLPHSRT